mgnify:CR=1 FL=1
MAGAEPRDFYLFMWMAGIGAEIVVIFKKGGRPQCHNTIDFRVILYDKCIWIVPVESFLKANLELAYVLKSGYVGAQFHFWSFLSQMSVLKQSSEDFENIHTFQTPWKILAGRLQPAF